MFYDYDIWLWNEIEGAEIDFDVTVTPTEEELALLQRMGPEKTQDYRLHRLVKEWHNYPTGTLVLCDNYGVLLFLHKSNQR